MAQQPTASTRKSESKGAAEETDPETDDSLPSSSTASYDPTVFQRPHPDDRGGADGGKPRKGGGKAKAAQCKTKDGKSKTVGRCGNCDAEGAKMKCSQCGTEVYCDEKCQRVSGRVSARGGWRCHGSYARRALTPFVSSPPAPRRSTGGTAATRRRARPTCSPTPSTRSSSGCARRRSRPIAV